MNNETKKEKKNTGKKIAVGVAAVVAVAAIAVPTTLALTGKDSASANAGNKYTIMVSTSLDTVADYTLSVESGTKISTLRTMLKAIDGYDIAGIYKDANLTTEYSDDEYISEDTKIFIKFEALTYTVKVYDENKQNPTTEEVDHGESLKLTAPENKETNLGTYKFLGYYTVVGDKQVDLSSVTSDLEIYPKFEIEYKEYSFGYSFGDGNDYTSSIKVSVGGEEKTLNDTYHYGSTIKLTAIPAAGHEVSEFKVTVAGQTTDLLTYAYMVIDNGQIYYETELAGNGNVTITYSEVAKQAYSIGTIPEGIKVTRNGTTLANDSAIYFGDELEISQYEDFEVTDFEITNAKHALGNTYYVTGNTEITATTTYAYSYLTFTEIDGGYEVKGNDSTITEATIPATYKGEKVISVGERAFYGFVNMTMVELPNSIVMIQKQAFSGCGFQSGNTIMNIPNSVISVGDQAFYGAGIQSIKIPSSVEQIGSEAFNGPHLKKALIDGDKAYNLIRSGTFHVLDTRGIQEIVVEEKIVNDNTNTYLMGSNFAATLEDGYYTFVPANTFDYLGFNTLSDGSLEVSGLTKGDKTNIVIPSIYQGKKVTSIADRAFNGICSINSIIISEGITSTGDYTFRGCENLTSVKLPTTLTNIGEGAFMQMGLAEIVIPEGVTNIGSSAFYECNITSLEIPSSVKIIKTDTFAECKKLLSVIIHEGVTTIETSAFAYCSNLKTIVIPSSVSSVKTEAFYACSNLNSVTIDSIEVYKTAGGIDYEQAGALLEYPTTVKVLKTIVDDPSNTNTFLNDEANYTKTIDGDYYVYTKVEA